MVKGLWGAEAKHRKPWAISELPLSNYESLGESLSLLCLNLLVSRREMPPPFFLPFRGAVSSQGDGGACVSSRA